MKVGDFFFAVFSFYERGDKLHRTRPVQRYHRDNVFQFCRFEFLQITPHPGTLQLEYAGGISLAKHFESFFIIQGEIINVNFPAPRVFDDIFRFFNNGQIF